MSRKVIIYGGSGGMGSATAKMLRARGYDLHLVGRNKEKLAAIAGELGAGFTAGDVNDGELFIRAAKEAGELLDGLVYAAGTITLRGLSRLSEADFINDFRVNAMGAALAVQACLPALKKCADAASVVLFSSVAAQQGFALHSSIGMAKGAVNGLTLSLAAELAPKVRVNAIAPSLTRTPLAEKILANDQASISIANMHPLPRLGAPDDMAALAVFLLSRESDWITGQIIGVDGGRSTLRTRN
jgi:NAD(P)-dependent dehydrogenase (short-subunit alcohol dehydrogenase family)